MYIRTISGKYVHNYRGCAVDVHDDLVYYSSLVYSNLAQTSLI